MVVRAPRDADGNKGSWIPVQIIGFDEATGKKVIAIHHDLCDNTRVPGDRDPARSHRISVNEDRPAMPDDQVKFRLNRVVEIDMRPGSLLQEG